MEKRFTSNDVKDNVNDSWKELRDKNIFCDVTLACEDNQIDAHKVILSASSSVFKSLLMKNSHRYPLLYFRETQYYTMLSILDFIYTGEITIPQEQINNFLSLATELKIKGLDLELNNKIKASNQGKEENGKNCEITSTKHNPNKLSKTATTSEEIKNVIIKAEEEKLDDVQNKNKEELSLEGLIKDIENNIQSYMKCDSKTNYKSSPNKHKGLHRKKQKDYTCEICQLKIGDKKDMNKHKEMTHGKVFLFCNKCEFKSAHINNLKRHKKTAHEGLRYPCEKCNYKASGHGDLKKHMLAIHKGVRLPCLQCDYKGYDKSTLKKHVLAMHANVRYHCELCTYNAKTINDVNRHVLTKHNGVYHHCTYCNYQTTVNRRLIEHTKVTHDK